VLRVPNDGNDYFRSINVELNNTYSRRDDLISVMYVIIHLINEFEPITRSLNGRLSIGRQFGHFKREKSARDFCQHAQTPYLGDAMEYAYELKFN
jgi:hypothetical protein